MTSLGVLLAGTNTSTLDVALRVVARHFSANATQASWIVRTALAGICGLGMVLSLAR